MSGDNYRWTYRNPAALTDGLAALQAIIALNVRFGSQADIIAGLGDVRFTPESGHQMRALEFPLSARSRHSMIGGLLWTQS